MALDSQYLNSGLAQTGTAREAGAIPVYDAAGNIPLGSLKLATGLLTATGTAAGTLSAGVGLYFFTGTSTATYTLPAEATAVGCRIHVINGAGNTNTLTIAPASGETINAATNTTTVPTNTAGSAALGGKTFYADPSTNTGFLAI